MESSEWIGRVGDVWAEEWPRTDRSFVPVDAALVATVVTSIGDLAAPRILDIGCGAGKTSLLLAEHLKGAHVTGVDLSGALLEVARARAADAPRCRFDQGDASTWAEASGFDLLVSRHGVMFFDDPVAAFAHLHGLTRPGGRLVFSCFRAARLNLWATALSHLMPATDADPFASGPFAFANEDRVRGILAASGWRDVEARPIDFDYVVGEGDDPVADAADYLRRIGPVARAARDLDGASRARLLDGLDKLVREHRDGNRVTLPAAVWIWSATA